jgi:plastocyanin
MRRLIVVVGLALLVGAAVPAATTASSTRVVAVKDDFFSPSRLTIREGATVTWRWRGASRHNVVGDGWNSPTMRRGTYSRAFRRAGIHRYVCTLHPRMKGKVVVD